MDPSLNQKSAAHFTFTITTDDTKIVMVELGVKPPSSIGFYRVS